jgi:triosephosphate isomerase
MRRPVLAGNWKMHKTTAEAATLAQAVRTGVGPAAAEVILAPPFTALHTVAEVLRGSAIGLAGQTMHEAREGAFTGEISASMLREVGCSHVLLGHSERRQFFGETDDGVAGKALAAGAQGLTPIVCVGETLAERDSGRTLEVVERQVERALRALTPQQVANALLAYEPVWAIGTGRNASPQQAQEVHAFIRLRLAISHGDAVAAAVRILYGGSVKPDNIAGLLAENDVDGALVGGASLSAASFLALVAAAG